MKVKERINQLFPHVQYPFSGEKFVFVWYTHNTQQKMYICSTPNQVDKFMEIGVRKYDDFKPISLRKIKLVQPDLNFVNEYRCNFLETYLKDCIVALYQDIRISKFPVSDYLQPCSYCQDGCTKCYWTNFDFKNLDQDLLLELYLERFPKFSRSKLVNLCNLPPSTNKIFVCYFSNKYQFNFSEIENFNWDEFNDPYHGDFYFFYELLDPKIETEFSSFQDLKIKIE